MPTITASVEIDAPPDQVWALFEDPNDYPELADPTQRMIDVPQVPIREGATYTEYGGVAPFFAESTWTVTEYRPYELQRHLGEEHTMSYDLAIHLTGLDGDRTRFEQVLVMQAKWFLRPVMAVLWPLMMRSRAQATMDATVANVKRAAERENS